MIGPAQMAPMVSGVRLTNETIWFASAQTDRTTGEMRRRDMRCVPRTVRHTARQTPVRNCTRRYVRQDTRQTAHQVVQRGEVTAASA